MTLEERVAELEAQVEALRALVEGRDRLPSLEEQHRLKEAARAAAAKEE